MNIFCEKIVVTIGLNGYKEFLFQRRIKNTASVIYDYEPSVNMKGNFKVYSEAKTCLFNLKANPKLNTIIYECPNGGTFEVDVHEHTIFIDFVDDF